MGSFEITCSVSRIGFNYEERCRVFMVGQNHPGTPKTAADWAPYSFGFPGEYFDYGRCETFFPTDTLQRHHAARCFEVAEFSERTKKSEWEAIQKFPDEFGSIFSLVSSDVIKLDRRLGQELEPMVPFFVHEEVYQYLIKLAKGRTGYQERNIGEICQTRAELLTARYRENVAPRRSLKGATQEELVALVEEQMNPPMETRQAEMSEFGRVLQTDHLTRRGYGAFFPDYEDEPGWQELADTMAENSLFNAGMSIVGHGWTPILQSGQGLPNTAVGDFHRKLAVFSEELHQERLEENGG